MNINTLLVIGEYSIDMDSIGSWHMDNRTFTFYFIHGGKVIIPYYNKQNKEQILFELHKKFNKIININ